jgi:hypothetical protein
MQWSQVTFDASSRVLRQFAAIWLIVFGALAARKLYLDHTTLAAILAAAALAVGVPGLFYPRSIRPVYGLAMAAAFPVGWLVSQALLALVFFGMFLPVAMVFRIIGRDALRREKSTASETYWEPWPQVANSDRYFRQF